MRMKLISVALGSLLTAAAAPSLAHHSFAAEFDANRPVQLEGTVTKMDWINPHSWIHIDVTTSSGEVQKWMVEGGAPNALLRRGWNRRCRPAPRSRCRASRRRTARSAPMAATSRSRTAGSCSSARRASARRTSGPSKATLFGTSGSRGSQRAAASFFARHTP